MFLIVIDLFNPARLNGENFNRTTLSHKEIMVGGTLELVMGPEPNTKWGVANK